METGFVRQYVQINDGVRRVWNVDRIWELAKKLEPITISISEIRGPDEVTWFSDSNPPTMRNVVSHCQRILDCDLSYPPILTQDNCVFDGMHRIARHILDGKTEIQVIRFEKNPDPDIGPKF